MNVTYIVFPYGCKNNSENSSRINVGEHIPSGYSMSTIWTFDGIENKHDVNRGEDCMKWFCEPLRDYAIKIINSEKKEMISLTNKQKESYEKEKICYICKKMVIVIILVNTEVLHIAYVIQNIVYLKKHLWFFTIY